MNKINNIMGIFGSGRSGTSWLGSIVDSHPQVIYRFEPFHRLRKTNKAIEQLNKKLKSTALSDEDLIALYQALAIADPKIERPPFFPKHYSNQFGKAGLRPLAFRFKAIQSIYQWLYTPRQQQPTLIFKEVGMERIMANILTQTAMKVVYLVRHPCGVVNSKSRGYQQGVMPIDRHNIIIQRLEKNNPALAERYVPQFNQLTFEEKEALSWLLDLELGIEATQNQENALIIIYEQLCADPMNYAQQIFNHFNLAFSPQTEHFLNSLTTTANHKPRTIFKELTVNQYFSVLRNPNQMKDKWKTQLSPEAQQRILAVVKDSPAFQFCAQLGHWEV